MLPTESTVWDLVVGAADRHPHRVLVADNHGRALTTSGLRDAAERVAAGFEIAADDIVSWQLPSVLEAVVVLAAIARVGATQNPIIPILRSREVAAIVAEIHSSVIIVPRTWRAFAHGDMAEPIASGSGGRAVQLQPA